MSVLDTPPIIAGVTSPAVSKRFIVVAAVLVLAPFTAEASSATELADTARVELQWGAESPLRNGVHLDVTADAHALEARATSGSSVLTI
jgi:hypothetical protein